MHKPIHHSVEIDTAASGRMTTPYYETVQSLISHGGPTVALDHSHSDETPLRGTTGYGQCAINVDESEERRKCIFEERNPASKIQESLRRYRFTLNEALDTTQFDATIVNVEVKILAKFSHILSIEV